MQLLEALDPARLMRMGLLALIGLIAIFIEIAPLGLEASSRPSPDLLLCVVAYWSIRRPGSAPAVLIFALGLTRDLLTDVPIGAGVLSLLLITEVLKLRRRNFARASFATEWVAVAFAAVASAALHWFLVLLTLAQPPYLIDLFNQSVYTMMAYPLMALFFRWGLRISWKRVEAV
jgi:rod shape-determining protein MreD